MPMAPLSQGHDEMPSELGFARFGICCFLRQSCKPRFTGEQLKYRLFCGPLQVIQVKNVQYTFTYFP
jgi:hypothetical protein